MRNIIKIPLIIIVTLLLCIGGFMGWMSYQMRELKQLETAKLSDSLFVIKGDMSNMFLLKIADGFVAFDASSGHKKLRAGFDQLAINPSTVKAVFLTHSDGDHAGGVPLFTNATIYLSEDEVPLLKEKKHRHFMGLPHMNKLDAAAYTTVSDNETMMIGDLGVTAIATPGHTRGSMCFKTGGHLFTGDLCLLKQGGIAPMLKIFTEDMAMDSQSIRKIATIEGVTALHTAHSGCCKNPQEALSKWRSEQTE